VHVWRENDDVVGAVCQIARPGRPRSRGAADQSRRQVHRRRRAASDHSRRHNDQIDLARQHQAAARGRRRVDQAQQAGLQAAEERRGRNWRLRAEGWQADDARRSELRRRRCRRVSQRCGHLASRRQVCLVDN
jgi:hypothetical protein